MPDRESHELKPLHEEPSCYLAILLPILVLTGCQRAPAFNVLGSYFPAWLFCLAVGMILTVGARVVFAQIYT